MTGQEIKQIRNNLELSQKDFGLMLFVSQETISKWELGHRKMAKIYEEKLKEIRSNI